MATEIKNEQIEQLTKQFKEMDVADLFKALKAGLTVAQSKASSKAKAKVGSMPKGACPPQLKLNNAWVKHVKDYVNLHGWEAFSVPTTMTDKETGAKTVMVEELPASIIHDGAHIFEGSVTEKTPQGVQVSHKHAMTLSKQWKEGDKAHLYEEFAASFHPEEESDAETESVASTESVTTVRVTMAEKIATKATKEAEKAAAKAEKEAEKAAAKEEKERAAAELKAKKALEAEAAKAEKVRAAAEAAALKVAKVPKAAIVKAAVVKAVVKEVVKAEVVKAAAVVKKTVVKAVAKAWTCEDDGNAHAWEHEGALYARNFTNDVWHRDAEGNVTEWAGIYLPAEDRIDMTAEEPTYEDE